MEIHTEATPIYKPGLSPREVALLSDWERERRIIVTLEDIRARVGDSSARNVASALASKGALLRVRRGTYLLQPFRMLGRAASPSSAVFAEALLQGEPHYLGGPWALSLHQLSEQRYDSVLDAFVTSRRANRKLGAARVRFHVLGERAFAYGTTTVEIEGLPIHVSDVERTVLDALDYPRVFFGIAHSVRTATAHLDKLDRARLISYAVSGSKASTCQRVGVLLERAGASERLLAPLRRRAAQTSSLLSIDPDVPRTGTVNTRWNVVENDL